MYKKQIRSNISVTPPYFALGTRKYNIFHCQLRNLASNLNQHKFLSHLSDGSGCPCGENEAALIDSGLLYRGAL